MHVPAQHFEGFDPEGYSIWFCEYKYPEENTVNYIVMNKVGSAAWPQNINCRVSATLQVDICGGLRARPALVMQTWTSYTSMCCMHVSCVRCPCSETHIALPLHQLRAPSVLWDQPI